MQDMLFDFPQRDALPERFQKWGSPGLATVTRTIITEQSEIHHLVRHILGGVNA